MSKKQMGFTLIEIVMVLVLLGILSAVAVPKYFDLRDQAELQAAQATVAEFQARLNARFASGLLEGQTCNNAKTEALKGLAGTKYTAALQEDDFGDWTIASVGEEDAKHLIALTVKNTTSEKVYPTAVTTATEKIKAHFNVTMPQCN